MVSDPAVLHHRGFANAKGCLLWLALLLLVTGSGGCAYFKDRGLDFTDMVDLKYGRCMGVGVKVEATDYVGTGLGVGSTGRVSEWYGRRLNRHSGGFFAHFVLIGADDGESDPHPEYSTLNVLLFSYRRERPPTVSRFRFGFDLLLPFYMGGLYLNLGEMADFIIGFSTVDLAGDDGMDKGERLELDKIGSRKPFKDDDAIDSVEEAIGALDSSDPFDRYRGVIALRSFHKTPAGISALILALKDRDARVRAQAAKGLGEFADLKAVPDLADALQDRDEDVRSSALIALRTMTGRDYGADPEKWKAWWEQHSGEDR